MNDDDLDLLARLCDGPDEGLPVRAPRLEDAGLVTVREGLARPTDLGVNALGLARARARETHALAALCRAASAYAVAAQLDDTTEPREELARAARALVRAEQDSLARSRGNRLLDRVLSGLTPAERRMLELLRAST